MKLCLNKQVVTGFLRKASSPSCHLSWWRMDLSDLDPIQYTCFIRPTLVSPQTASRSLRGSSMYQTHTQTTLRGTLCRNRPHPCYALPKSVLKVTNSLYFMLWLYCGNTVSFGFVLQINDPDPYIWIVSIDVLLSYSRTHNYLLKYSCRVSLFVPC